MKQAPFRLTLFGGPTLEADGRSIPLSPLQRAVVAVLATHGPRGARTEEVISLLWPDGTDHQVRRRFSQLIYSIHRRLGARVVRISMGRCAIDTALVSSDLEDLEGALGRHDVTLAAEIVASGFCSDLTGGISSELEQWVGERNVQLRSSVRTLVSETCAAGEVGSDWESVESAAEAWIVLDPQDERVLRRLLRAMALRGRVREAEARYEHFRASAVLEDPTWTPASETDDVISGLGEVAVRHLGPDHATRTPFEPPLVGRGGALDVLAGAIRTSEPARVRLIVVSGEAGIGKTRLVREALARLPLEESRVVQGTCSAVERSVPMGSLARALTADWVSRALGEVGSPWEGLLVSVLPHLWSDGIPAQPAVSAEELPFLLREAVRRLLTRASAGRSLVLFLDDAHLMDPSSVPLLAHLAETWTGGQLSIVLALRPDEVPESSALGQWLTRGGAEMDVVRLPLGRLDRAATHALVSHAASRKPSDGGERRLSGSEIDALVELSLGHPLLAIECVLGSHTELSRDQGDRGPVSATVHRTVMGRFSRLPPEARRLLSSLSPHEGALPFSLVEALSGLSEPLVPGAFDHAVEGRFVEITSAGVRFRHGLVREAIYQSLGTGERILAHRSVARALEGVGDPSLAADIAFHFFSAGEPGAAAPHALRAAEAAMQSGGWSEARGILERVLDAEALGLARARAAHRLTRVAMLQGDFRRAAEVSDIAEAAFIGAGHTEDALLARLHGLEARVLSPASDHGHLLEEVRGVRARASERGMRRVEAECLSAEVRILDGLRRVEDVRGITRAARVSRGVRDDAARLKFLFVAMHDAVFGDPVGAAGLADEAVAIADRAGDPNALIRALNWKIIAYGNQALLNTDDGRSLIERALDVAAVADDLEQRFQLHANVGCWHLDAAQYDAAEESWTLAEGALGSLPAPHLRRNLVLNRGQHSLEVGDLESARHYFEGGLAEATVSESPPHRWVMMSGLGLVELAGGSLVRARKVLDALPDSFDAWTFDPSLLIALRARLEAVTGRAKSALELLAREERSLLGIMAPAWMRARLLRVELARRHGETVPDIDIAVLEAFLRERKLEARLADLRRLGSRSRTTLRHPPQ